MLAVSNVATALFALIALVPVRLLVRTTLLLGQSAGPHACDATRVRWR